MAFVVLALTLRGPYGHVGVSMAVAGSSAVQMVLLFVGLKLRLGTVRSRELGSSVLRVGLASLVAAAAAWGSARLLSGLGGGAVARAVPGVAGLLVFGALYLVVTWGAGSPELAEIAGPLRRRLARRRR
jgi:peptidoglycan biosynthesis protein MviN/MurJ (putative lipid II flippase)